MPELCNHDDPSWCTAECEAKTKRFDEWVRNNLKGNNMATKADSTTRYEALDMAIRSQQPGELVSTTTARAEAFLRFLNGQPEKASKKTRR